MAIDKQQIKQQIVGGLIDSAIGGALSVTNDLIGGALSGGKSSTIGDTLGSIPIVGGILGGGVNALIGSKLNEQAIQDFKNQNQEQLNRQFNASNNEDLLSQSQFGMLGNISKGAVGEDGVFSNKAGKIAKQLNRQRMIANNAASAGFNSAVQGMDQQNDLSRLANIAAFGGTLTTQGGIWDNGLTYINNGNTHEQNPYEGVQIGTDKYGVPNLVEEGEVIFDDYVLSNRLPINKDLQKKYKMKKGITYAEAAKKLSKETEERPNDPISKNYLNSLMSELINFQESDRAKKQAKQAKKDFERLSPEEQVRLMNITNQQQEISGNQFGTGGPFDFDPVELSIDDIAPLTKFTPAKNYESQMNELKRNQDIAGVGNNDSSPLFVSKTGKEGDQGRKYWTGLKYFPLAASAGQVLSDALGITNKPDYSQAQALADATIRNTAFTPIKAKTVNNYLRYNPEDINYQLARMAQQSAATRRNLVNQSAGNRATALNSLLAQNYADQLSIGESIRAQQLANRKQYEDVLKYNNDLESTNNAAAFEAAKANQALQMQANKMRLDGLAQSFDLIRREQEASENAKTANINNLLANVGNFAKDEQALRDRDFALSSDLFGTIPLDIVEKYFGKRAAQAVAKKREEK